MTDFIINGNKVSRQEWDQFLEILHRHLRDPEKIASDREVTPEDLKGLLDANANGFFDPDDFRGFPTGPFLDLKAALKKHGLDLYDLLKPSWAIPVDEGTPKIFLADKDFVLRAVGWNASEALKLASEELKDDYDVVLAAVRQDPDSLAYASDRLQRDESLLELYRAGRVIFGWDGYRNIEEKAETRIHGPHRREDAMRGTKTGHALEVHPYTRIGAQTRLGEHPAAGPSTEAGVALDFQSPSQGFPRAVSITMGARATGLVPFEAGHPESPPELDIEAVFGGRLSLLPWLWVGGGGSVGVQTATTEERVWGYLIRENMVLSAVVYHSDGIDVSVDAEGGFRFVDKIPVHSRGSGAHPEVGLGVTGKY